jgi:pectate lyase
MELHSRCERSVVGPSAAALLACVLAACSSAGDAPNGEGNGVTASGTRASNPAPAVNPGVMTPGAATSPSETPSASNEGTPTAVPVAPSSAPALSGPSSPQPPSAQPSSAQPSSAQQPAEPQPQTGTCNPFPAATGDRSLSATMDISGTFDGNLVRFTGTGALGNGSQQEGQDALFELAPGATIRNVILGSPAADGIHCQGACTIENVWWEDVGEDAATFRGNSATQEMRVSCAGARGADDKVFQHNGAGTLTLENITVENFGKLYRSCGNCSTQFARHIVLRNVTARDGQTLVGLNSNLGDTATFQNITLFGDIDVCDRYTGNDTGAEPTKNGTGADGSACIFSAADISQR